MTALKPGALSWHQWSTCPEAQAITISEYLATHYPSRPDKKPNLIPGDFDIEIQEWQVPTLGQRSRDPVEAPDGSIWWTGMWASLAGRLDPETGKMEEFQLPKSARPHSIVPDKMGFIWYLGNGNGTVGRLDPGSGTIEVFPTTSRDPHTGVFHPNGKLYFTAQHSGMLGRLDPVMGGADRDSNPSPSLRHKGGREPKNLHCLQRDQYYWRNGSRHAGRALF